MAPKQNRIAECVLGDRRWVVPCSAPPDSPFTRLFLLRLSEPCIVCDVVPDTRLPCATAHVDACCPLIDESQGGAVQRVLPQLLKRRGVTVLQGGAAPRCRTPLASNKGRRFFSSAALLHCDESVSEADVCSHASAVVDDYALSKAQHPAAAINAPRHSAGRAMHCTAALAQSTCFPYVAKERGAAAAHHVASNIRRRVQMSAAVTHILRHTPSLSGMLVCILPPALSSRHRPLQQRKHAA